MSALTEIGALVQSGKARLMNDAVDAALSEGFTADEILCALTDAMSDIGEKFKNNLVYVPEVLVSARAMSTGIARLKPLFGEGGMKTLGKACIGTVRGDLHDIGKNLVKLMLESKGIEVVDLGVDVSPEAFVEAAENEGCDIICCSALLTTTMGAMKDIVELCAERGIRDRVSVFIGGAPISQAFCDSIGADIYTPDAASAASAAERLLGEVSA